MDSPRDWPEPIVRVQSLSERCTNTIPERYVKPPGVRSSLGSSPGDANIPLIDLGGIHDKNLRKTILRHVSDACRDWGFFQVVNHGVSPDLMDRAREVWREFFHQPMEVKQDYANSPKTYEGYGSRLGVEKGAILDWSDYYYLHYLPCGLRDFNKWPALPNALRPKSKTLSSPQLLESDPIVDATTRLGFSLSILMSLSLFVAGHLDNGDYMDWNLDTLFNCLVVLLRGSNDVSVSVPFPVKQFQKMESLEKKLVVVLLQSPCKMDRCVVLLNSDDTQALALVGFCFKNFTSKDLHCGVMLKIMSINLGLSEDYLQNAFGGDDVGACLRVNFYPKCPQPDLTLGLSSHSDPGGMTFLLPDQNVPGLQVRRDDDWITVKPAPHAFIVNIGDQIQVLSNAIYKSVEHRVIVNSGQERISLAYFYNPKSDLLIQPAKELVAPDKPALYPAMTFDEYRLYIRTKGPKGKSQLGESLKSPR
ncbi:hypothetical protein DH2020_010385 [Rehmannia glutinosa]|uniref:Fe2OG dioxygenase domain-containing protein n=1 Tax=Rehmannia glutinosa TaxID=99300 RepID=A0ABR0XAH3_REHGL